MLQPEKFDQEEGQGYWSQVGLLRFMIRRRDRHMSFQERCSFWQLISRQPSVSKQMLSMNYYSNTKLSPHTQLKLYVF